jgi:hypothetical protein
MKSQSVNKIVAIVLAAATFGVGVAATATPAAAWEHHHGGWGGPVAGGIIGGLALGALASSAAAPRGYYVEGGCWFERQPVVNRWGDVVGYRRVRVCD